MVRSRFIDARASGLPNSVGLCATDLTALMAIVNEAQERLINDPLAPDEGFFGSWAKIAFTVSRSAPTIVAPAEVARIIVMDLCKTPVRIRNQFYEYLTYGVGLHPKGCGTSVCHPFEAFEREIVTTFSPLLPTPQIIRAYAADPSDLGRGLLIQGKDANGQIVRFLDALSNASGLGERIVLDSPFTDTANHFSEITGVQKQKSFGEVQLFQVNPTTGVEAPLMVMSPSETTAQYRSYYLGGIPCGCCNVPGGVQVMALCRLNFIPVQCDSDYLMIQNIAALIDECQAIRFSRMDTPGAMQLSAAKHASALRLLFGQLDSINGREQVAIQRHLFGSSRMRLQPI